MGYADPSGQTDFTESFYEPGPLGRIDSVITPQWYARKAIREINQANEIPDLNNGGHYAKGTLFKAVSVDENGNKKIFFTDLHGDEVAMRQESEDGTEKHDTYNRYDLKKNKVQILPPGATEAQTALQFNYLYYGNGQMARRDLPDSDPINYVYNQRDQLSYRQDGNMQDSSRWWGTIYDEYGNVSIEGWFNGNPGGNGSFDNASLSQLRIFNIWSDTDDITKGKLTKNQSIFLMTDEFSETDYFYDNCGRLEEESNTIYNDNITLFTNSLYPKYDSRNEVYESRHILRDHNLDFHIITKHFDFDHRGSIIGESFQYGLDGPIVPLTTKSYTHKEQVKSVVFSPQNPLANIQYEYLPNGFLKKTTDPLFTQELFYIKNGNISKQSWQHMGDVTEEYSYTYDYKDQVKFVNYKVPLEPSRDHTFGVSYFYGDRGNRTGVFRNSGTISPNVIGNSGIEQEGMTFHYFPNSNQISHVEYTTGAKSNQKSSNSLQVYDSNGNVIVDKIDRSPTILDVYYDMNFLNKPNRTSIDANNYVDYYYDASGRFHRKMIVEAGQDTIIRDYVRDVELVNGEIDLVHFSNGFIKFRNDLTFTENLILSHTDNQDSIHLGGTITSTSTVADQSDVTYIAEECITMNAGFHVTDSTEFTAIIDTAAEAYSDIEVYYSLKDHLGSTRVVFSDLDLDGNIDTSEVLQTSDYYPFGAEHNDNKTGSYAYRFNGKEKELGLGLLDLRFEARTMNVLTGSFMGVDPLADLMPSWSPYSYTFNSPVNYIDVDGLYPQSVTGDPPIGAVIAGTIRAGLNQIGYNAVRRIKIWGGADPASIPYRRFGVYEDASSALGVSVGYEDIAVEPSVGRKVLDNALAVADIAAVYPTSGVATFAKAPGMFGSEFVKNASAAFREAYSGGKHSGYLENVINTGANINKSINKLTRRIGEHKSYINDPAVKYGDQWNTFSDARKQREIGHWQTEIQGFSEQVDILRDVNNSSN